MILLCLVCVDGSLYLGFRVWNCHVTWVKAERRLLVSFFGLAGLQDSGMYAATGNDPDCRKGIALGFVFKSVSWLAGDNRLRQTFSLRIHKVGPQSLSP